MKQLREDLERKIADKDELFNDYLKADDDRDRLSKELNEAQEAIETLKDKLEEIEKDKTLHSELIALNADLEGRPDTFIPRLKRIVEVMRFHQQLAQKRETRISQQLVQRQQEFDELKRRFDELSNATKGLEIKPEEVLGVVIKELKASNTSLLKTNESLSIENQRIKEKVETDVAALKSQIKQLTEETSKLDNRIKQQVEMADIMERENKIDVEKLNEKIAALQKENEKLQNQCIASLERLLIYENATGKDCAGCEDKRIQIDMLKSENERLKEELKKMEALYLVNKKSIETQTTQETQEELNSPFPPKMALNYADIKFLYATDYCKTFEAVSKINNERHTIRLLNKDSAFYKNNPNLAATLFIQELLRLCVTSPTAVFIESFECRDNCFAYALKHCQSLRQLQENKSETEFNVEKIIAEVLSDTSFLLSTLKLSNKIEIDLQSIYYINATDSYFLGDWGTNIRGNSKPNLINTADAHQIGADEIYSLGMNIFELQGISKKELKEFEALSNNYMYDAALDAILAVVNLPQESTIKLKRMLQRSLYKRMKLAEFSKTQEATTIRIPQDIGTKFKKLYEQNGEFQARFERILKEYAN